MKQYPVLIFIVVLTAVYINIGLFNVINLRPQSIHQWPQCDRASVARNFAEENFNFFKPRVHERSNGTGISGMEFPVVNYVVAIAYKIFGFHEYIYRCVMMFIVAAGMFFAFLLSFKFTQSYFAAGFIVLLFNLSPVVIFYMPNFIPDAASLGLILVSWYMFFKIYDQDNRKENSVGFLFLFFVITALACLIKITSLINVFVMLIYILIESWKKIKQAIHQNKKLLIALFTAITVTFAWYCYSYYLSSKYQSYYFLLEPNTISSYDEFVTVINKILNNLFHQYYPETVYYLLIAINCFCLLFIKKLNHRLLIITLSLYAGFSAFIFLMLKQFIFHDYYIITVLPAILFNMILFAELAVKLTQKRLYMIVSLIALVILCNYSMIICKKNFADRYKKTSWLYGDIMFDKYFDLEDYLRELGLKKSDWVLSITDESPNNSLYLMNQNGIVIHHGNNKQLAYWMTQPVKYAVINDTTYLNSPILKPHLQKFLGKKNGIFIYELKSNQ